MSRAAIRARLAQPSAACRDAMAEAAEQLLGELDDLVRYVDDGILAELPDLGEGEMRDDLDTSTTGNVRLATTLLREWDDPYALVVPPEALVWSRSLVPRGVPVETLVRVYRLGQARYWERLSAALRAATDDVDVLTEAMSLAGAFTFAYVDAVLQPVIADYADARERWLRSADAMRSEEIRAILDGAGVDEPVASARLGYALSRWHLGFLVWTDPGEDEDAAVASFERAAAIVATALGSTTAPLLFPSGRLTLAGWIATDDQLAADAIAAARPDLRDCPGVRVAVGEPGRGVDGFRATHVEARTARRVARATGLRTTSVARYGDLRLLALLTDDLEQARRFVLRELGPLATADDTAARLVATLAVYQEEQLSFARAARRLGVHENTVAYRMRKVAELLGRDDLGTLELRTAVRLLPTLRVTETR